MKRDLNLIAEEIQEVCEQNNIDLTVKWIRRTKNLVADTLSRWIDLDDWGITSELLQQLQDRWGKCDVDRFASAKNKKLSRFNSRFASTGAEAIDAFS